MSLSEKISAAREIAQIPRIAQGEDWYPRHVVRRFSIYLSYFFWKLGISANALTVTMGVTGLIGSVCIVFDNLWLTIAGAFFWHLCYVLDYVDGEVARLQGKSSLLGIYLDMLTHIFINPTFGLALGIHVCLKESSLVNIISTFVVYSAWHWRKNVRYITSLILAAEYGVDAHKVGTHGFNKKPILSWLRFIIVGCFNTVGQIFIIPAIIILNRAIKYDITSRFLHLYAIFILGYIGLLILHDGHGAHQIDFQKCRHS